LHILQAQAGNLGRANARLQQNLNQGRVPDLKAHRLHELLVLWLRQEAGLLLLTRWAQG
jgi:hypothetical protein